MLMSNTFPEIIKKKKKLSKTNKFKSRANLCYINCPNTSNHKSK